MGSTNKPAKHNTKPQAKIPRLSNWALRCAVLIRCVWLAILGTMLPTPPATAGTLQVNATVSDGHYLRHINLNGNGPTVSIAADWSANNGVFTGAECYVGDSQRSSSFDRACFAYLGYFKPLNHDHALSFEARHYDYHGRDPIDWDTDEYSVSWHHKEQWLMLFTYSDDWLARRTATLALDAAYRHRLNDSITLISEAGILWPESRQQVGVVTTGSIGFEYQSERWIATLKANFIDSGSRRRLRFVHDQPELFWSIGYRIY